MYIFSCLCKSELFLAQNACQPNPCLNGGMCYIQNDEFKCKCHWMYNGRLCEHGRVWNNNITVTMVDDLTQNVHLSRSKYFVADSIIHPCLPSKCGRLPRGLLQEQRTMFNWKRPSNVQLSLAFLWDEMRETEKTRKRSVKKVHPVVKPTHHSVFRSSVRHCVRNRRVGPNWRAKLWNPFGMGGKTVWHFQSKVGWFLVI